MVGTSTIVHWTAYMGRAKCLRLLKKAGADFTVKDADNQEPFFYAKKMNHFECMEIITDMEEEEGEGGEGGEPAEGGEEKA